MIFWSFPYSIKIIILNAITCYGWISKSRLYFFQMYRKNAVKISYFKSIYLYYFNEYLYQSR